MICRRCNERMVKNMKEILLYGITCLADGTEKETLISREDSTGEWEQSVNMCADAPINDYDGFLFIEDDGRQFRYYPQKPLRRKRKMQICI